MITTYAEILEQLGVGEDATENEMALAMLARRKAESAVKAAIGYDPAQATHAEIVPRLLPHGLPLISTAGVWEPNAARTRAHYSHTYVNRRETLQLTHLPLRRLLSVKFDPTGRFGQSPGAFGSGTELELGEDCWSDFDTRIDGSRGYGPSGCVFGQGSWTLEPGSVEIQYVGGYSRDELEGQADADATSPEITSKGVDAYLIKVAVFETALEAFVGLSSAQKTSDRLGFTAGQLKSERFQDYAYSVGVTSTGTGGNSAYGTLRVSVPPDAMQSLHNGGFIHYGRWRL